MKEEQNGKARRSNRRRMGPGGIEEPAAGFGRLLGAVVRSLPHGGPIVEELADEYSRKVNFYKINTDDNVQTASKYGIRSIPTLLVFKDGQIVDQLIGFRPKSDLKRSLEKALS